MEEIICPYCGHEHDYSDLIEELDLSDCGTSEVMCEECERTFIVHTSVSYSFDAEKADCLNGLSEHNWEPTHTSPKCATKMCCSICGQERNPTVEERERYGIPTMEDYFKELNEKRLNSHIISDK